MPDTAVPARPSPPLRRWMPFLAILGIGGAVYALAVLPVHGVCGFRVLTGAPCPACGLTRACLALLRGDVATAWRFHPASFAVALTAGAALATSFHEGWTGRPTFRRLADRWGLPVGFAGIGVLAALWAARVLWQPDWSPDPIVPGSPAARILK